MGQSVGYSSSRYSLFGFCSDMFTSVTRHTLDPEKELRVEVKESIIHVKVVDGTVEIFGCELPAQMKIAFTVGLKFTIFTWYGATIEIEGTVDSAYVADETPMISYINVHAVLERRRTCARQATSSQVVPSLPYMKSMTQSQGPRVIIVGPNDSGKSSLSRMLLGWATRQGWKPTFVDLDISQGSLTIAGTLVATPVEIPIDPLEGIPSEIPLVYFYGHDHISNIDSYKALVKELAQTLEHKLSGNSDASAAGMVINTMGWTEGTDLQLLLHGIECFSADVVLVLGQEKLYHMLRDKFKSKVGIDIVKLHKSGGVVDNRSNKQRMQKHKIREYFYGLSNTLSPRAISASFKELRVFRIGGGPQAPRSALPIGAKPIVDPTRVVPVTIGPSLVHCVLAVSYAKEPNQLLTSNVAGFIHITEVDVVSQRLSYVSPCPGPLPNNLLLAGSLSWLD